MSDALPFLAPPQYVGPPVPLHARDNRAFQGIPSIAVTAGGRRWVTYYASPMPSEDENCYVVLATAPSDSQSWKEVLVVDPDGEGPVRAFDPQLWAAPDGTVRLFWAQAIGHDGTIAGVWSLTLGNPEQEDPGSPTPRRLTDGVMMGKPLVLSTGEWVLPTSTWRKTNCSARMVASTDSGENWTVRGGCHLPEEERAYDEHHIIERKDRSLWLLARTANGIGESISQDRGATWPDLQPSPLAHPSSRFFLGRLHSGNLLMVKHGPLQEKTERCQLTAYLSRDDGESWIGGLLLDPRLGVSYPDAQQDTSGAIHVVYDFQRTVDRHILLARIREEDILQKSLISSDTTLQQDIAKASGGWEEADA